MWTLYYQKGLSTTRVCETCPTCTMEINESRLKPVAARRTTLKPKSLTPTKLSQQRQQSIVDDGGDQIGSDGLIQLTVGTTVFVDPKTGKYFIRRVTGLFCILRRPELPAIPSSMDDLLAAIQEEEDDLVDRLHRIAAMRSAAANSSYGVRASDSARNQVHLQPHMYAPHAMAAGPAYGHSRPSEVSEMDRHRTMPSHAAHAAHNGALAGRSVPSPVAFAPVPSNPFVSATPLYNSAPLPACHSSQQQTYYDPSIPAVPEAQVGAVLVPKIACISGHQPRIMDVYPN